MKKAVKDVLGWITSIKERCDREKDPHKKAILKNYYTHVALEFNGRWEEFLGPDMAIDEPVYKTRLGSEHVLTANGYKAVLGFYNALNQETVLTNHTERLAIEDWGFASYNTFNIWTTGKHLAEQGIQMKDAEPDAHYCISRPIAMFWNYTPDAKLIGEEVYEVCPPTVTKIPPAEFPTWEEVRDAVKSFLPPKKLRVKEMAA